MDVWIAEIFLSTFLHKMHTLAILSIVRKIPFPRQRFMISEKSSAIISAPYLIGKRIGTVAISKPHNCFIYLAFTNRCYKHSIFSFIRSV